MEDGSTLSLLTPYPINSIYMAESETSPASIFGGEWEKIEKRFLLGHGSGNVLGQTGGEETHTLISNEIPNFLDVVYCHNDLSGSDSGLMASAVKLGGVYANSVLIPMNNTGDKPHNNMPPFYVVNIWKRVA